MLSIGTPEIQADKNGEPEKIVVKFSIYTGTEDQADHTLTIEKLNETEISINLMYADGFEQTIEQISEVPPVEDSES